MPNSYWGHLLSMASRKSHASVRVHIFVRSSSDQKREIARCGESVRMENVVFGEPRFRKFVQCPRCISLTELSDMPPDRLPANE